MNVINMSKKTSRNIDAFDLPIEVFNTEGDLFKISYRGEEKILKKLHHQEGPLFANKLYTLEMLNTFKSYIPEGLIIPDYLVTFSGNIIGFTTPYKNGKTLVSVLNDNSLAREEQLYYLKKVGKYLEQMEYVRIETPLKDFYFNDLHDSNFVVDFDKKELYGIDLDSCKIFDNKPFPARYLTPMTLVNGIPKYKIYDITSTSNYYYYSKKEDAVNPFGYMIPDKNTDIYCYIMMILGYLTDSKVNTLTIDKFYELINKLRKIGYDKELLDVFSTIIIGKDNINPIDYLDTITNEQINKSRLLKYLK